MKKINGFLFALLFLTALNLYPQELTTEESEASSLASDQEQLTPPDESRLYVISDFEFDIKGRTLPFALINNAELKKGEKIQGDTNLKEYIRDKTQMLINQRVLKNNAEITYSVGEEQSDGTYPVTLFIKVEESWNIIALPQPSYSSNSGFEITIKARDYNFLGTMNPLRVDLGYRYDEKGRNSFNFDIDSDTPFEALGLNWNFQFTNTFRYRPDVEEPYYYRNVTGLSVEVPFETTTFTFGLQETLTLNEENADSDKPTYGNFQEGMYMSTRAYGSWKLPTGVFVSKYGELTYSPWMSTSFYHELPDWPLQNNRRGPSLGFGHSLGFGRIDWHANLREGLSASIGNSYSYNFYSYRINSDPFSTFLSVTGTGHFIIKEFFGISSRAQFRHWYSKGNTYHDNAGDNLRGILDKAIWADYMMSLNIDLPFRVLVFVPSKWLNNSKLRLFDFEFHVVPILDMALYHDNTTDESFIPKHIAASGGLEFIVYPSFFRRLYLRFSVACNIKEFLTARPLGIPGGNNREISLTMGHFF